MKTHLSGQIHLFLLGSTGDVQSITKLSYIYSYCRLLLLFYLYVCVCAVRASQLHKVKQIGFVSFVSVRIENHIEVFSVNVCKFVCLFLLLFRMVFVNRLNSNRSNDVITFVHIVNFTKCDESLENGMV